MSCYIGDAAWRRRLEDHLEGLRAERAALVQEDEAPASGPAGAKPGPSPDRLQRIRERIRTIEAKLGQVKRRMA